MLYNIIVHKMYIRLRQINSTMFLSKMGVGNFFDVKS